MELEASLEDKAGSSASRHVGVRKHAWRCSSQSAGMWASARARSMHVALSSWFCDSVSARSVVELMFDEPMMVRMSCRVRSVAARSSTSISDGCSKCCSKCRSCVCDASRLMGARSRQR